MPLLLLPSPPPPPVPLPIGTFLVDLFLTFSLFYTHTHTHTALPNATLTPNTVGHHKHASKNGDGTAAATAATITTQNPSIMLHTLSGVSFSLSFSLSPSTDHRRQLPPPSFPSSNTYARKRLVCVAALGCYDQRNGVFSRHERLLLTTEPFPRCCRLSPSTTTTTTTVTALTIIR